MTASGLLPMARFSARLARGGLESIRARVTGRNHPLLVGWAVTNYCDLHCSYCDRPEYAGRQLDTQGALKLADEIGRQGVIFTTLTGGEPLIRKDLGAIVDRLRASGVLVGVNSDGTLLPRRLDEIASANMVTVSLDGPREIHDHVRGSGSYDKAVGGIRACLDRGMRVNLHTVVTRHNVGAFAFFPSFAQEHGLTFSFSPVDPFPLSSPASARMVPETAAFRVFIDRLLDEKRLGARWVADSEPALRYMRHWPEYSPIRCSAGKMFCRIEPDGSVYSCGALIGREQPRDGAAGLRAAIEQLDSTGCRSCWVDSEIEMNLLYGFNPDAVSNAARMVAHALRPARH